MILVDRQIRSYQMVRKFTISPFDPCSVNPNSYDLHLGNHFQQSVQTGGIDPYNQRDIERAYSPITSSEYWIQPGEFILARTVEKIALPSDVVATVEGKSSLARLGLTVHQTGGWIDAGFMGSITLEISNCNRSQVRLTEHMPIAQLVFFQTAEADTPYQGKYQNQEDATISRYHQNGENAGSIYPFRVAVCACVFTQLVPSGELFQCSLSNSPFSYPRTWIPVSFDDVPFIFHFV